MTARAARVSRTSGIGCALCAGALSPDPGSARAPELSPVRSVSGQHGKPSVAICRPVESTVLLRRSGVLAAWSTEVGGSGPRMASSPGADPGLCGWRFHRPHADYASVRGRRGHRPVLLRCWALEAFVRTVRPPGPRHVLRFIIPASSRCGCAGPGVWAWRLILRRRWTGAEFSAAVVADHPLSEVGLVPAGRSWPGGTEAELALAPPQSSALRTSVEAVPKASAATHSGRVGRWGLGT